MSKQKNILKVSNLTKSYGEHTVVKSISFEVNKGEIFGILGPNGAGKTSTLEMLEGLRDIDGGEATLNGIDVAEDPQKIRHIIGIQLQTSNFYDKLTLSEQLKMFGAIYGRLVDPIELLKEVELIEKISAYPENLSGGQRQRFSIAVGLVNEPLVLFLDEPTTGLDPQSRRHLWELVKSVKKKGITVIMTTHYMEEAEVLCDRVAIMDEGKIIALDTPKNLVKQLLKRGFKKEAHVEQADLEDVFIDLTGKELRE